MSFLASELFRNPRAKVVSGKLPAPFRYRSNATTPALTFPHLFELHLRFRPAFVMSYVLSILITRTGIDDSIDMRLSSP